MRSFPFVALCLMAATAFAADDQATVTTFELKDGQTLEAIRFAAAGEDGAKTYMLTTLEGERKTIAEKDILTRKERIVLLSELPSKAREQIRAVKKADATARAASEDDAKAAKSRNHEIAVVVRKEIDARIAFKKINDQWARDTAEQAQYNSELTQLAGAIAAADAERQAATAELASLGEPRRERKDNDAKQEEAVREARRDSLRKRIRTAAAEHTRLTNRREATEKRRDEIGEKLKDSTRRKDASQAEIDALVAEKSKAIVASIVKRISPDEKSGTSGETSVVKLVDGTTIRARSVKSIEGGMLLVVDENGKERRVRVRDVDVSE